MKVTFRIGNKGMTLMGGLGLVIFSILIFMFLVAHLAQSDIKGIGQTVFTAEYTPDTVTVCNGDRCSKTIYQGVHFVEEKGEWVGVEEAKSLKDSGIRCVVKSDGIHEVECVDYNYTHRTLRTEYGSAAPFKVFSPNMTKDCDKGEKGCEDYYEKSLLGYDSAKDIGKEIVIEAGMRDIIHFGENSSTVELTDDTDDVRARKGATSPYAYAFQIKWDISSIPSDASLEGSQMCFLIAYSRDIPNGELNVTWISNQTWTEGDLTAAAFNNQYTQYVTVLELNSTTVETWSCFNSSLFMYHDYLLGNDNMTVRVESSTYPIGDDAFVVNTGEYNVIGNYLGTSHDLLMGSNDVGDPPVLLVNYSVPPTSAVYLNGLSNGTFPHSITAYCTASDGYPCSIYRNSTNVTFENNTAVALGAQAYNYTAFVPEINQTENVVIVGLGHNYINTNVSINGTYGYSDNATAKSNQYHILNNTAVNITVRTNTTGNVSLTWSGFGTDCFGGAWESNYNLVGITNETSVICSNIPTTSGEVLIEALPMLGSGNTTNTTTAGSLNKIFTYIDDLELDTVDIDPYAYRGVEQTITASFRLANGTEDMVGTLGYNGLFLVNNSSVMTGNQLNLSWVFIPPTFGSDVTSVSAQFNYSYADGIPQKQNVSSGAYEQSVTVPFISTCNSTLQEFIYLDFRNETSDFGAVNTSIGATFNVEFGAYSSVYNFTAQNDTWRICGYPSDAEFEISGEIRYTGNYSAYTRYYNLYNDVFTNETTHFPLYHIAGDMGTVGNIGFTVKDADGSTLPNAIIRIQRYYPELDNSTDDGYRTIAAPETNSYGEAQAYLLLYDVEYRFIILQDGVALKTFEKTQVTETSITLTLDPEIYIDWLVYGFLLNGNCEYTETTGYLDCWYAEGTDGYLDYAGIVATQQGALINSELCSETNSTQTYGTFRCNLGNTSGTVIFWRLTAYLNTGANHIYQLASGYIQDEGYSMLFGSCDGSSNICLEGVFVAMLIVLTAMLIGIWQPTVSILLGISAMVISSIIGLFPLSMSVIVGMVVTGVFVVFILARSKT